MLHSRALIVLVAIFSVVAVHGDVIKHRRDTGTASIDYFSMLDGPTVNVNKFKAYDFGANVLEFRQLTTTEPINLAIPGSVTLSGDTVVFGGKDNVGPISVSAEVNDVFLATQKGSTILTANGKIVNNISGAKVEIASQLLQYSAANSFGIKANEINVDQSGVNGIAISSAGNVALTAGSTFSGRIGINSEGVLIYSDSTTLKSNGNIATTSEYDTDVTGNKIQITASNSNVDSPSGKVYFDAVNALTLSGGLTEFAGDSNVLINSVTGNVNFNGATTTASSATGVQIQANSNGMTIKSTAGTTKFTATDSVLVQAAQTSVTATTNVAIAATQDVRLTATSSASVSANDVSATTPKDLNVAGQSITGTAGSFKAIVSNDAQLLATHTLQFGAGSIVGTITGPASFNNDGAATLSGGAQTLAIIGQTGVTTEIISGGDITTTSTGLLSIDSNTMTFTAPVVKFSSAKTEFGSTSTQVNSGDDVVVDGTDVLFASVGAGGMSITTTGSAYLETYVGNLTVQNQFGAVVTAEGGITIGSFDSTTSFTTPIISVQSNSMRYNADNVDVRSNTLVDFTSARNYDARFKGDLQFSQAGFAASSVSGQLFIGTSDQSAAFNGSTSVTMKSATLNVAALENIGATVSGAFRLTATGRADFFAGGDSSLIANAGAISLSSAAAGSVLANGAVSFTAGGNITYNAKNVQLANEAFYITAGANLVVTSLSSVAISTDPHTDASIGISAAGRGVFTATTDVALTSLDTISLNGTTGASLTAGTTLTATSSVGRDINLLSGGSVSITSNSTSVSADRVSFTAVENTLGDGGVFRASGAVTIRSTAKDISTSALDTLNVLATSTNTIKTTVGPIAASATNRAYLTGGGIAFTAQSAVIHAYGGGARFESTQQNVTGKITTADIVFTATDSIEYSAGESLTFDNVDGHLRGVANGNVEFAGGLVHIETAVNKTLLLDGNGGVVLSTGNQETLNVTSARDVLLQVTRSTNIRATGAYEQTGTGVWFHALTKDVCYTSASGAKTFDFDGSAGVLIESTNTGANVGLLARTDVRVQADGTVGISSNGWDFDPLDLAGLRIPLGVLLRTVAPKAEIQLATVNPNAGISLTGAAGVNLTATGGAFSLTSKNTDLRTTDYLAPVSLLTRGGVVSVTASGSTYLRAGTRSLDSDLSVNATNTLSLKAVTGSVSFAQIGANSDSVHNGLQVFSEKGHVQLTAANGPLSFDASSGNGRLTVEARTLGASLTTQSAAAGAVSIASQLSRTLIDGATSATFVSNNAAITIDAQQDDGSLTVSSGGLNDIFFTTGAQPALFKSTASSVLLNTVTGIKAVSQTADVQLSAADDVSVFAAGSLSVVSRNAPVTLTANRVQSTSYSETRIDAATYVGSAAVPATAFPLIRITPGGDRATPGLKVNSRGNVLVSSVGDSVFNANSFDLNAGTTAVFQTVTNGDLSLTALALRGGDLVFDAPNGAVNIAATNEFFLRADDSYHLTSTDSTLTASATGKSAVLHNKALVRVDHNAPNGVWATNAQTSVSFTESDFTVTTATTQTWNALNSIDVQSDSSIAMEAGSLLSMLTTLGAITVETLGKDSDIEFFTLEQSSNTQFASARALSVNALGDNGHIRIDGTNGVSITAPNGKLTAAADDALQFTGANNLVISSTLVSNTLASYGDVLFASAGFLSVQAQNGLNLNSAAGSVRLSSDRDLTFADTGSVTSTFVASGASSSLLLSSNMDTSLKSKTFASTSGTVSLFSTGLLTAPGGRTAAVTTDAFSIAFNNNRFRALAYSDLSLLPTAGPLSIQNLGSGSLAISGHGPEGVLLESAAGGVTLKATAGLVSLNGNHGVNVQAVTGAIAATTQASTSFTAPQGNIEVFGATNIPLIAATGVLSVLSNGRNPNEGIVTFVSTNDIVFDAATDLNMFAADDFIFRSEKSNVLVGDANARPTTTDIIGHHSVTFDAWSATPISISSVSSDVAVTSSADVRIDSNDGPVTFSAFGVFPTTAERVDFRAGQWQLITTSDLTKTTFKTTAVGSSTPDLLLRSNLGSITLTEGLGFALSGASVTLRADDTLNMPASTQFSAQNILVNAADRIVTHNIQYQNSGGGHVLSSSNSIFLESAGALSIGSASVDMRSRGPRSDIKMTANSLLVDTAGRLVVTAELNLGPIEGMISSRQYNFHAIEMVAINGGADWLSINGDIIMRSASGAVQFRSLDRICYESNQLGFFLQELPTNSAINSDPIPMNPICTSAMSCYPPNYATGTDICASSLIGGSCPSLSELLNTMVDAVFAFHLVQ